MSKLLLLLLVALGIGLYFPDSRAWLFDKARPVMDPILSTATKSEMDKIVGDLHTYARENLGRYPDPKQFPVWLDDKYAAGGSRDSWDTPYELEDMRRNRTMRLRSWGPDRMRATDDDLLVEFQREGR